MKRSQEVITDADLRRLLQLVNNRMVRFFRENPRYEHYKGQEAVVALCQGAALHYLDKTNGVKDFDVWLFYPSDNPPLPWRSRRTVDFGKSRFGVHPDMEKEGFVGRSIDILMRSDAFFKGKKPDKEIVDYLKYKRSSSSNFLSEKAVIGLYPESVFGAKLWPI